MKIKKFLDSQVDIICASIIIWGFALLFYKFADDDLSQNIISEAIWATITIVLIDKIIEFNEKRRRLPAQLLQVSKLIAINCKLLQITLPQQAYDFLSDTYKRGAIQAYISIKVKPDTEKQIHTLLEEYILTMSFFDPEPINLLNQQLNTIITSSAYYIEVDLLNWLLLWEESNTILVNTLITVNWVDEKSKANLCFVLKANVQATLKVHELLLEIIHKELKEFSHFRP